MHTGDEDFLGEDGYLFVTGRIKDLIIRGGENIAPLEIAVRLFEHPAIKQACVFGIPDEKYGLVVAAFLELEDGMERPEDEIIREQVRGTLSIFKFLYECGGLGMWREDVLWSGRRLRMGNCARRISERLEQVSHPFIPRQFILILLNSKITELVQEGIISNKPRLREKL